LRFAVPTDQLVLWLIAAPAFVAVVLSVTLLRRRRAARSAFAEPELFARIASGASLARVRAKLALIVLAIAVLGLAAGRPQIGTRLGVAKRRGIDLMIAIDVSASMRARDLKPDRLTKAKREAMSLIELLDGDRVGIMVFSGAPFVQCPLTLDYGAASMLLSAVEPGAIPKPGTALGEAIKLGVRAMETQPDRAKVLVVMTDGEDHGSGLPEAAREAAQAGIRIYTIGFGSTAGEPIPLPPDEGGGYKRDKEGRVVMSRLGETALVDIADATGGRYFRATSGERELVAIEEDISRMEQGELESRMLAYYQERFQFPLAFALGIILLESFLPERVRRKRERT
jgi:Ca-activated chloride channel family protein